MPKTLQRSLIVLLCQGQAVARPLQYALHSTWNVLANPLFIPPYLGDQLICDFFRELPESFIITLWHDLKFLRMSMS